jgi:hypothetical protein
MKSLPMGDAKAAKGATQSILCITMQLLLTKPGLAGPAMRRTALLIISLLAILILILTPKVEKPMTENQKYLKEARAYAEEFEDNLEPEMLKQSYLALENVILLEEDDPKMRSQLRADSLYLWLQLIQLLDRFLDPDFDPDDVPEGTVQPPPTSEGIVYPPGADPALIDDTKARAEYEKAIAANNAKTVNYTFQTKLRRLNERITPRAEEFIRDSYTPTPVDQKELKTAIDEVIEDPRRKESLLRLLTPLAER